MDAKEEGEVEDKDTVDDGGGGDMIGAGSKDVVTLIAGGWVARVVWMAGWSIVDSCVVGGVVVVSRSCPFCEDSGKNGKFEEEIWYRKIGGEIRAN